MRDFARVSAVFLLVSVVWACAIVGGGEVDRREASRQQPRISANRGVGTKTRMLAEANRKIPEETRKAKVEPLAVFKEVQKGLRSGTPKPFERYLGKGKVRLDFGEGGPRGGLFTRGQAYYLIADYLRRTQTVNVGFSKITDGAKDKSRPYALLHRESRHKNGMSKKEVVFVSLRLEDSLWVISELRAIPAK